MTMARGILKADLNFFLSMPNPSQPCTFCACLPTYAWLPVLLKTLEVSSKSKVFQIVSRLGSAIKNLGLFSKTPGDFRIEAMDF